MKFAKLAVVTCLFMGAMQVAAGGKTIQITTGEYAPWTSASLKHRGFTNHVIAEAFRLEGYEVEFTFYPWKRVYESARDGKAFQATSFWYPSDERAKEFHYSDPLQTDKTVFFHLKRNSMPDWTTLADLKGERIGATREYTYNEEFWNLHKSGRLNIQVANSDELNFNKLIKGRIDIFPTGELVGQKLLREKFSSEVVESVTFDPKPLVTTTGHLLISKTADNSQELLEIFNRGLAKLKESGRYAQFQADLTAGKYDR